ncbi:MAG: hypothetical protein FAF03_10375 [Epsilonproteobacteria bacterium]|nr:hypothetical protein [Campylobacterota bacterium]
MDNDTLLYGAIILFGVVVLVGFFKTKKDGYGRFNTATLLMLLVFIISSLFAVKGIFDKNTIINIMSHLQIQTQQSTNS